MPKISNEFHKKKEKMFCWVPNKILNATVKIYRCFLYLLKLSMVCRIYGSGTLIISANLER